MKIDKHKLAIATEIFSRYTEDNNLVWFNILHIYPDYSTKLKDNDCYRDALKFKAVIYNTETDLFKELGSCHDRLDLTDFYYNNVLPVRMMMVYADGSILVRFSKEVRLATKFISQVITLTIKELD